MLTARRTTFLAPAWLASSIARFSDVSSPEMTNWPGQLSLANCTTPPVSARACAQTTSIAAVSMPRIAAMPPGLCSPASFISRPRSRTRRRPSAKLSEPAATRAVYSPMLWPATADGAGNSGSISCMARNVATLVANSAGCALIVSVSTSSGPSKHNLDKEKPKIASASAMVSAALLTCWARCWAMPTACEPWPGKRKAMWDTAITANFRKKTGDGLAMATPPF